MKNQLKIMLLGDRYAQGHIGTFSRGAIKLGHIVSHIPTRKLLEQIPKEPKEKKGKRRFNCFKEILENVEYFKPDIIIHNQPWDTPIEIIEKLKAIAPILYWTVDDPHQYITKRYNELWRNYDGILSCCKECVSIYESEGIPSLLFYPPMVDPAFFYSRKVEKYDYDICFTFAQLYLKEYWNKPLVHMDDHMERPEIWFTEYVPRDVLIKESVKYGSVLAVGLRHKFYEKIPFSSMKMVDQVANEFLPNFFSSCKVNINSHAWPTYYGYLNKRTWMILASGGFQLCDAVVGIEEVFTPGEHLITYNSLAEYGDKLRYYLKHNEEREKIAKQGCEFVFKNYRNDIVVGKVIEWIKKTFGI